MAWAARGPRAAARRARAPPAPAAASARPARARRVRPAAVVDGFRPEGNGLPILIPASVGASYFDNSGHIHDFSKCVFSVSIV